MQWLELTGVGSELGVLMKSVEGRRAAANSGNLFVALAVGAVLASAGGECVMAQTAPSSQPAQPAAKAQTSQTASAQASKAKGDPRDQVICRHQEEMGTRLGGSRVCHTKREWDQIAQDGRDLLNDAQTHVNGSRY